MAATTSNPISIRPAFAVKSVRTPLPSFCLSRSHHLGSGFAGSGAPVAKKRVQDTVVVDSDTTGQGGLAGLSLLSGRKGSHHSRRKWVRWTDFDAVKGMTPSTMNETPGTNKPEHD